MNGDGGTRVEHPHGFVHTGSGHIIYTPGAPPEPDRPVFRTRAEDQLRRLRQVLVAPPGMGRAREVLADTGTVVLDGAPGTGRAAAARVLLRECPQDTGVFHELLPGEDEDELALHDPALVGSGDRLLLDLSAADDRKWSAASADLPALRKAVHEQHAHLVVVMPDNITLDPELQHYRVTLQRPPGLHVLKRHLRRHGLPYEQYMRPDSTVTKFLSVERPMREIADFADLVRRARETAPPSHGFAEWCATAVKARKDRRREVAELVAERSEAPQRALLIAVSMLHGAHADVVHRATQLLLYALGPTSDGTPLLQHKDLAQRLDEISAETGPAGQVRFKELDQDSAVRAHFWNHMPDLRPHLGNWAANVVELDDPRHIGPTVRDGLVAHLAGEYLRTGRAEELAVLAERWSSRAPTSRARQDAAVQALTCGLQNPVHGREFRGRIYQWCQRPQPEAFARVLVRLCADVITVGHPDQALLRLYYLARRERAPGGPALEALDALVAGNRRLRRRLLDRLTRYRHFEGDLPVFLHTCDPVALTDTTNSTRALVEEEEVQQPLAVGWQAVLTGLPRSAWQPYAARWLHHSGEVTRHRGELLLDILVEAAGGCGLRRGEALASLYVSARAAERTAPGGPLRAAETTALLFHKIGAAQRRGPAEAPHTSAKET
ncbi:hypothetical protein [Streptomyces sp. NPDC058045]|uniref:hypothetical protein n=1 Tax=Streptomyces sp. NPDC058045 TaxID=3346311 RepID=UPI0036E7E6CA